MAILKFESFEIDEKKVAEIQKEVHELSSEAEIALKEYFTFIFSISNRKYQASQSTMHSSISQISR